MNKDLQIFRLYEKVDRTLRLCSSTCLVPFWLYIASLIKDKVLLVYNAVSLYTLYFVKCSGVRKLALIIHSVWYYVTRSLMVALLRSYRWVGWWWNNFENRSIFDAIMAKKRDGLLFALHRYICVAWNYLSVIWSLFVVHAQYTVVCWGLWHAHCAAQYLEPNKIYGSVFQFFRTLLC